MPAGTDPFALVTAVTATGPGRFSVDIDPGWTIVGKPNGGYLLAILGRAALATVGVAPGDRAEPLHVVSAGAQYLRSPDPGAAEVDVVVLRVGRSLSQARARLTQAGGACVEAHFTLGDLPGDTGPEWAGGLPEPEMPGPADCLRLPTLGPGGFEVAIMDRIDLRLDPACLGFAAGRPSGRGELRGWLELPGGHHFDSVSLLFAVDALPPATFDISLSGWVPTIELTAYVRRRPASGPVRINHRVQLIDAGRCDEICHVWDSSGRLVAQATQLALIRAPA